MNPDPLGALPNPENSPFVFRQQGSGKKSMHSLVFSAALDDYPSDSV